MSLLLVVLSLTIPASAVLIFLALVLNPFLPLPADLGNLEKTSLFKAVFNSLECWWMSLRYVEYIAKRFCCS